MTPDWSASPVLVPYADLGNPQTFNLYAYVANNPLNGVDPEGHFRLDPGTENYNDPDTGAPLYGKAVTPEQALNTTTQQSQQPDRPGKPEIVIVVVSDTTHEVIIPGSTTVVERDVIFAAEQKDGDKFTRLPGDHDVTPKENQTGGNEKPVICKPACTEKNQIEDNMHVGGKDKTHTVQRNSMWTERVFPSMALLGETRTASLFQL
jgi:hypothetical protein